MSYTVDQLVDLLGRNSDREGWLQPLLDDPDSAAVVLGALAVLSRQSLAIDRASNLGTVGAAPGGDVGTTVLVLTRATNGTSGTIPRGYAFVDARGVVVVSQTPVPVPGSAKVVLVPTQTLRQTESVNSEVDPGFRVSPGAPVVMDSVPSTVLIAPPGTAGLVSTSFSSVTSADPIQGAAADWLSQHGLERGVRRQPNEDTGAYRSRVRNIPDAVSPIAVADGAESAALRASIPKPTLYEPFNDGATASLKVDHGLDAFSGVYASGGTTPDVGAKTDFYDDAGQDHEVLGLREARAYMRAVVPQPRNPDGFGLFFDEGYFDDPALGYPDLGAHPAVVAAMMSVWEEIDRKRAGGVQFDVYVGGVTRKNFVGNVAFNGEAGVIDVSPLAGRAWILREGWADHDAALSAPGTLLNPATMKHRVRFTFTDSTAFTTALTGRTDSERFETYTANMMGYPWGKRMNRIEGFLTGDGAATLNLAITLFLLDVVDP